MIVWVILIPLNVSARYTQDGYKQRKKEEAAILERAHDAACEYAKNIACENSKKASVKDLISGFFGTEAQALAQRYQEMFEEDMAS